MKKWVKATSLLLVAMMAISLSGCGKKPAADSVATVNGEDITKAQLDNRITKMMEVYKSQGQNFDLNSPANKVMKQGIESQILEGLIKEKLLLQEAKKQGVMPSDADINKQVTDIKKRFTTDKEFKDALTKFGMDEEGFLDWVKQNLASKGLYDKVTKGVTVSEADIKTYYDQNKATFNQGEKVKAQHILIKFDSAGEKVGRTEAQAKKMADDIIVSLKNGGDFAKLAKAKSEDPGSKDKGGEYTFGKGEMMKAFEDAAFGLKVGGLTQTPVLVKSNSYNGFHIIKLLEKIPAKNKTFEEAKAEIQNSLPEQKKQEFFTNYTNDLEKKAKITRKITMPAEGAAPATPAPSTATPSTGK